MPNLIDISGCSSPEEVQILAKQFLQGSTPFKASAALYAAYNDKGAPQTFPLVIDGSLDGIPCNIRIAGIDFTTASLILAAFGIEDKDLVVLKNANDDSTKFFLKKQ